MAYTRAGMKAVDKYVKANYDRIEVKVPKGQKAEIEAHAKGKGTSVNSLINDLIRSDMGVSVEDWKAKSTGDGQSEE